MSCACSSYGFSQHLTTCRSLLSQVFASMSIASKFGSVSVRLCVPLWLPAVTQATSPGLQHAMVGQCGLCGEVRQVSSPSAAVRLPDGGWVCHRCDSRYPRVRSGDAPPPFSARGKDEVRKPVSQYHHAPFIGIPDNVLVACAGCVF